MKFSPSRRLPLGLREVCSSPTWTMEMQGKIDKNGPIINPLCPNNEGRSQEKPQEGRSLLGLCDQKRRRSRPGGNVGEARALMHACMHTHASGSSGVDRRSSKVTKIFAGAYSEVMMNRCEGCAR